MSDSAFAGATKGLLWAVGGAAIALVAVYTIGLPQPRQPASATAALVAPAPPEDKSEALRARLAALEQEVAADRKRIADAMERSQAERAAAQRAEAERARPVERAAPPPKSAAAPKPTPPAQVARSKPSSQPVVAIAPVAAPEPPRAAPEPVASPAPQAKPAPAAPAEVVASAERFAARGRYSEAAAMLKPLADQGNVKAQSRLGQMYLEGQGVERNEQEGLRLARNAAKLGDADAQLRMGGLYEQGRGLPQNIYLAYVWYSAALRSGNAAASAHRDRVAGLLQTAEIEQADKVAADIVRQSKER